MQWFVEEKGFHGQWCPAIYYSKEPPSEKRTEGARRVFKAPPKEVKPEHMCLTLPEIVKIYGSAQKQTVEVEAGTLKAGDKVLDENGTGQFWTISVVTLLEREQVQLNYEAGLVVEVYHRKDLVMAEIA